MLTPVMTEGERRNQEASIITCSWIIESRASGKLVAYVSSTVVTAWGQTSHSELSLQS